MVQPLLLNPAKDEIGDYLEFHRYLVVAKDTAPLKEKAEKTIELFQLNDRKILVEKRKGIWNNYWTLCKLRKIALKEGNQEALAHVDYLISKLRSEKSEFTGMFKYQRI